MTFTKNFTELSKNDTAIAGGKGASLGEMTQAGIPVPPGFVVLSNAFEQFIQETGLAQEIDAVISKVNQNEMHTIETASDSIRALILGVEMPKDIAEEILKQFVTLNTKYVAVRSSATAEDGKDHAWAGQLESYLNTEGRDVLIKVKLCWSSLFTPRAIFYRFEKGLENTKISVAVVIQTMVNSEVSGIAFSVHPISQNHNQLVIEAGYGLGEAIVSGQITPDSYVVEKNSRKIIDSNISEQNKSLVRGATGENTWIEILPTKAKFPKLDERQILELSNLVINIEAHYGFPCDIEWAYEDGKFYITQSRPITTLSSEITVVDSKSDTYRLIFASDGFAVMNAFNLHRAGYTRYGGVLAVEHNNKVSLYIKSSDLHSYGEDGYKIFSSKDKVNQLISDVQKVSDEISTVDQLHGEDVSSYSNEKIAESLKETAALAAQFFSLYGLLEPQHTYYTEDIITSYTSQNNEGLKGSNVFDIIFKDHKVIKDQKIRDLCDNVATLARFKLSTKESINGLFKSHSILVREARKHFELSENEDIRLISLEEIQNFLIKGFDRSLFDQKVNERKDWFVIEQDSEGNVNQFVGSVAKDKIEHVKMKSGLHGKDKIIKELSGQTASVGIYKGRAVVIPYIRSVDDEAYKIAFAEFQEGDILVTKNSVPEIMEIIKKASAIVTEEGGITCHGAIMAREFKVPGIVGVDGVADHIRTGDIIEVDAEGVRGKVKIVSRE